MLWKDEDRQHKIQRLYSVIDALDKVLWQLDTISHVDTTYEPIRAIKVLLWLELEETIAPSNSPPNSSLI